MIYEMTYEIVQNSLKQYEMDFLVRVYEMKFEEFLTSCTCMKWSVKWFYEMQTLNIASQNFTIFHTISVLTFYEMVYETV